MRVNTINFLPETLNVLPAIYQSMNKVILLVAGLLLIRFYSFGQAANEKILFVVDSIPVIEDPKEGDDIQPDDIAVITVIKNKDTLNRLGYGQFDGVTYIFTKEYRNRPDSLRQILSTKQMKRVNGAWLFNGQPYSGRFIDYYYSGRRQGDGTLINGKLNGFRAMYYQNGKLDVERYYKDGLENGLDKEYY